MYLFNPENFLICAIYENTTYVIPLLLSTYVTTIILSLFYPIEAIHQRVLLYCISESVIAQTITKISYSCLIKIAHNESHSFLEVFAGIEAR